jgi:hypothetical protein
MTMNNLEIRLSADASCELLAAKLYFDRQATIFIGEPGSRETRVASNVFIAGMVINTGLA